MMGTEKGKAYLSHLQKKPNEPFMFFYRQNSYPYTPVAFFLQCRRCSLQFQATKTTNLFLKKILTYLYVFYGRCRQSHCLYLSKKREKSHSLRLSMILTVVLSFISIDSIEIE